MITFVTGNKGKAEEITRQTNLPIQTAALDLYEVQSLDVREVIEAKAREAFKYIGTPVLVDDASVAIDGMGGLPGALVRWFLSAVGNEGICRFADQSPTRAATASVAIGYFDGIDFVPFISEVSGHISDHPRGEGGYGWDAVFIQEGYTVTRAELSSEDYSDASIRRPALESLRDYLKERI